MARRPFIKVKPIYQMTKLKSERIDDLSKITEPRWEYSLALDLESVPPTTACHHLFRKNAWEFRKRQNYLGYLEFKVMLGHPHGGI